MSEFEFLTDRHPIAVTHDEAWRRDERRLVGGDAVIYAGATRAGTMLDTTRSARTATSTTRPEVLDPATGERLAVAPELTPFKGEDTDHYAMRQAEAEYLPLPERHASILAGHLRRVAPAPNFGTMGEVRARADIRGAPSLAELFHYNADGIGADGSQYPAFCDGVQVRACATGLRWTLVEMPPPPAGRAPDAPVTARERAAGHRPYLVEFSPLRVPIWEYDRGRLDWAVARVPVGRAAMVDGVWTRPPETLGYYLFVRAGFAGLGDRFAAGGWWLFDGERQLVTQTVRRVAGDGVVSLIPQDAHGTWARTRGQIPLVPLLADDTPGTTDRPALGRSLTMELGQLAVGLMNRVSERDYNARQAAKSVKYLLGADPKNVAAFNLTAEMHESGAILIPVVAYEAPNADGNGSKWIVPQIYDSASGAVETGVYQTIIDSKLATAREIMVRQVSAGLDASGRSREAAFGEATSPLLARMAQRREGWENALIHFAELRAGATEPTGSVTYPTEFDLAPVVDDIDATLNTLRLAQLRSPTLEARLVRRAAEERGQLDDPDPAFAQTVETELAASAERGPVSPLAALLGGGAPGERGRTGVVPVDDDDDTGDDA